jgi:PAS domain S-box-containing protein
MMQNQWASHRGGLINSLWKMDLSQVSILLRGMCEQRYMQSAEIEYKGKIIASCGTSCAVKPSGNVIEKEYSLSYNYRNRDISLGVLRLTGSKDYVWSHSVNAIGATLAFQSLGVLLVAALFYFIFQYLVTRHLVYIADELTANRAGAETHNLVLKRPEQGDELQDMVGAINSMQEKLVHNINELKDKEKALRQSEESYRHIFENAVIGVFQTTPAGRIIKVNKTFARTFGYGSPEEIIHAVLNIGEQLYFDSRQRTEMIRQLLITKEVKDFEAAFRHKSGSLIFGRLSVLGVWDDQGNLSHFEGFFEDITARKLAEEERDRLETQLAKAQKMEAIGTLAGGIAHNFNNILTAILGNLSLGLLQCEENHQLYKMLSQAEEATLKARSLAQQLLTFAKGGVPNRQPVFLPDIIKKAAALATAGASSTCEFSFPEELWAVEADPDQIGQVINNLVLNALQAMPGGGPIKIGAENITLKSDSEFPLSGGHYTKIYVRDQGVGIPPEISGKIFDPYFTTKESGTGLGLTSVYSIIKKHGGHILAETNPDGGATFSFFLPAIDKKAPEQARLKEEAYRGKGRILVMDDEEMVREIIGTMISHLGYKTACAKDGEEAVKLYQEALKSGKPFDALIMDLVIPSGMGGKETIKELLALDPRVKAIVSSGYSDDPVMAHYKEYGFSAAIKKPFRIGTLSKVLSDCLKS